MKIPKSVTILGKVHEITKENTTHEDHYAQALHKDLKIAMYSTPGYKMPEPIEAEVFLHEIIHCVEVATSMEITESDVNRLSRGLFAIIRDNNLDFRAEPIDTGPCEIRKSTVKKATARKAIKKVLNG